MGDSKGNFIKDSDLSFIGLLKHYKNDHELFSVFHIFLSLIISIVFIFIIKSYSLNMITKDVSKVIISSSTSILAILIAAFGLFAAITDISFSKKIYNIGQLRNLLFPFWFSSILWVLSLLYGIFVNVILNIDKINVLLIDILFFTLFFLFIINIGYTLALIGDILKLTIRRVQIEIYEEKVKKLSLKQFTNKPKKEVKRYNHFFDFYLALSIGIIIYSFFWHAFWINYSWVYFITGILYLSYFYSGYKFYLKLKDLGQKKLINKFRNLVKYMIIIIGYWIVICIL